MHFSRRAWGAVLFQLGCGCYAAGVGSSVATEPRAAATPVESVSTTLQEANVAPVIVTENEIAEIIEDLTGRPAPRRVVRTYRERALSEQWDVDAFVSVVRESDLVRRVTPERAIEEAYRELLHRSPTRDERDLNLTRLRYGDWTPGRLRTELRKSEEYQVRLADEVIDEAFHELLERRPDTDERRHFRREIIRRGRTEEDVRRALRKTEEFRVTRPNEIITAVFLDLLGREPDLAGCEPFRQRIRDENWTREDFARHVRRSPEYRERVTHLITLAYRELLGRDPDPAGLETYRKAMLDRDWSEEEVRQHLRRSAEYKKRKG